MSAQNIKIMIAGALFFHGVAHAVAFFNLLAHSGLPAQSWLFPALAAPAATALASIIWGTAAVGFIVSAMSFWGVFVPGSVWRQLTLAATFISILGVVLCGIWPGSPSGARSIFHIFIASSMNGMVLIALLWLRWPPVTMFGK